MARAFARNFSRAGAARYTAIYCFDALATAFAFLTAVLVRFEGHVPAQWHKPFMVALPLLVAIRLTALTAAGLHRWSFTMSGLSEALRLTFALLASSAIFIPAYSLLTEATYPRSVWALEFFSSATLIGGWRFGPRIGLGWWGEHLRSRAGAARTLIVGTGNTAEMLARDLHRHPDSRYRLIGFVDQQLSSNGMRFAGRPVLGTLTELPTLIARHGISTVLLAIPRLPAKSVREILGMCDQLRARFKIIPASFTDLDDRISAALLHDLSPDDLLPRDQVAFDEAEIRELVDGRTALVTGAGGSIGGEVCRQLARNGARRLVMVDLNENELYLRCRQLAEEHPDVEVRAEVIDVREQGPLLRLGERHRPEYVLHAAAHKHVPLMEEAPDEAVKNNVFGTLHTALMARQYGAERFVLISTDKAVNPSSVMGASKRVAELAINALAHTCATHVTAVRFGNVLGSAGSVVPLFKQQIARGGPVTVTHPECTRYFMTISEAVGLVLLAGLGDYGQLCTLEMGEPIRIANLARNLITMSGRVPDSEVAIVYTGLRPGEKLHEELLTEQEELTLTVRDRIRVARVPPPPRDLAARLDELRLLADLGDRAGVLRTLRLLVPSYRTPSDGAAAGQPGTREGERPGAAAVAAS